LKSFFGDLSPRDVWRSDRLIELATRRGLLWSYRDFQAGSRQEREILQGVKAVMGRTAWDRVHLRSVNPSAKYYHVGEILRSDFKEYCWDLSRCDRHTIIYSHAGESRRGVEVLLRALQIIQLSFPDAKLRLGGGVGDRRGYHRFLRRTIAESGLSNSVELLGYMDGGAMSKELSRAHLFATASYVENSPNALCEAMQVGLPCVATYVGGIPSLIKDRQTGLLFPPGDAPLLADAITKIFRDDDFAIGLGRAARIEASKRHAPQRVITQLLNAYHDVVANGGYLSTRTDDQLVQMNNAL
jgi:glycosyltransferase involved in cell wall biosynthesis